MFGRKKQKEKQQVDAQLLNLIYTTRDGIVQQRALLNVNADGARTERQKANIAVQEGLFDFLHRQARMRRVSAKQVEEFSVRYNLENIN